MESDREVVKGEQVQEKKGWSLFGGGKKDSKPQTLKKTPPPPGTGKTTQATSSTPAPVEAKEDDDLPPRQTNLETSQPQLQPHPEAESGTSTPSKAIPKHAGFDFQAISEAIGKKGLDPSQLKVVGPGRGQATPPDTSQMAASNPLGQTPGFLDRSESAPPLTLSTSRIEASGSKTPPARTAALPSISLRNDAPSDPPTLLRSLSLNDCQSPSLPSPSTPKAQTPFSAYPTTSFQNPSTSSFSNPYSSYQSQYGQPQAETLPTMSFGNFAGDVWAPASNSQSREPQLSFGGSDGFTTQTQNVSGPSPTSAFPASGRYSSYPLPSPYGGYQPAPAATSSTATLTFGDSGGAISETVVADIDPWVPKPIAGGTKKPAWTMNPWET